VGGLQGRRQKGGFRGGLGEGGVMGPGFVTVGGEKKKNKRTRDREKDTGVLASKGRVKGFEQTSGDRARKVL